MTKSTIVIPTRNRLGFLRRLLSYLSLVRCQPAILISDSSDEKFYDELHSIIELYYSTLNITFIHLPPALEFPEKIFCSLEWVTTPFVTLNADDDFIVPTAVENCAAYLESNPDYALAHGHALIFNLKNANNAYYGDINYLGVYDQAEYQDVSALKRLQQHAANYQTTFYSTHRLAVMKKIWSVSTKTDLRFRELIPTFYSAILGKSKKMDQLYMVRQSHSISDSRALPDPLSWMASEFYSEQFLRMQNILAGGLSQEIGGVEEDRLQIARNAVAPYFIENLANSIGFRLAPINDPSPMHATDMKETDPRLDAKKLLQGESPFSPTLSPILSILSGSDGK